MTKQYYLSYKNYSEVSNLLYTCNETRKVTDREGDGPSQIKVGQMRDVMNMFPK